MAKSTDRFRWDPFRLEWRFGVGFRSRRIVVLVGLRGRFQAHANTVVKWRASLILIQIETCLFGVVIVASLGPGGTFFVWTLC